VFSSSFALRATEVIGTAAQHAESKHADFNGVPLAVGIKGAPRDDLTIVIDNGHTGNARSH
jgi:hypothetical protein